MTQSDLLSDKIIEFITRHIKVPEGAKVGEPMVLAPFQVEFIRDVYDNKAKTRRAILSMARKNGKALPLDTPIPTPDGFTSMGDLRPGDFVLGSDGKPTQVVYKSPVHINKPCYRIEWDDGSDTIACEDHLWNVRVGGARRGGKFKTVSTAEIARIKSEQTGSVAIPLAAPAEHSQKDLPIDPYVLGAWLGDGSSAGASTTCSKQDVEHFTGEFEAALGHDVVVRHDGRKTALTIGLTDGVRNCRDQTKVQPLLRRLGVLGNKHIPDVYMTGSVDQRWALLQGLMDTDGACDIGNGHPRCDFTQKSLVLAQGVQQLAHSLGLKASLNTRHTKCNGKIFSVCRVTFNAYADQPVFRLQRKQSRLKPRPEKHTRAKCRYVKNVVLVDSVPTQCIQVSADDSLYLCGKNYVVTHNTALIAALLLAHLCSTALRRPNASIVSAAATRDQAALVFDLAVKMIQLNPALATVTRIIPSSKTIIGLKANTTYKALSADAQSAHGLSPAVLISDEAGQIVGPSNRFIDALITSQGAHENPLQIFISTQAANDADLFSALIDDAIKSSDAKTVVHIYRADDDCDLMDREQWKKANPGLGLFRSEEDLAEQLQQASRLPSMEAMSRNLLLNCRISLERQAFAPKIIADNNGESDWQVFRENQVYAGLDLSRVNDLTACVLAADDGEHIHIKTLCFTPLGGIRERSNRDRVPYDVWADQDVLYAPPGDTLDYEMICEWLTMLMEEQGIEISGVYFDRWRAREFFKAADEKGFATLAHREGVGQGYQSMSPRLEAFETALLQKRLKLDNHPCMNMAVAAAIAVTDPSGNRKLSKPRENGPKIDPVVAALMAVYPCVHKPEEMGSDLSFWVA